MAIKLALFTTGLGYLAIDLWVVEGPVYRMLHPLQTAAAEEALLFHQLCQLIQKLLRKRQDGSSFQ